MVRLHVLRAATAAVLVLALTHIGGGATSAPTYLLQSQLKSGQFSRIESLLEVGGELAIPADGKSESVKMSVVGNLDYHERILAKPSNPAAALQSVRYYDRAEAVIKIGDDGGGKPLLREDRRVIGVQITLPEVTLFSPMGSLSREELDLVDVLGNSLVIESLLPPKAVAIGDRWTQSSDLIAALLGLDYVSDSDAISELKSVQVGMADVHLTGAVRGRRDGVIVDIGVKAKYRFDLQAGRIIWFGLLTEEKRGAGETAPGINCVARLQMTITPESACENLSDDTLAGMALVPSPGLLEMLYRPTDGGWQIHHARNWYLANEDRDLALLRLVDGNERLGQCLIRWLPPVPEGKQMEVEAFQQEVRTALGDDFKTLISASQKANAENYRVIRVVAEGVASDVPIRWIYYLLSDHAGRQVALAFTIQADKAEQFADADQAIVDSLRIMDLSLAKKP